MENNFFNLVPGGSNPELTDSYGLNLPQTANLLNNNETTPLISLVDTEINPLEFNEIPGTSGRDEITGTIGDDLITGSYGKDIITAGTGIDIFVYNSMRDAGDIITDFDPDQDLLDLNVVLGTLAYEGEDPVAEGYVIFDHYQGGADVLLDRDGLGPGRSRKYIQLQFAPTDNNEAPNDIALDGDSVTENADGAVIGTISVSDPDTEPEFTNNIVTVSDNRFEVVDNGGTLQLKLKAGQILNYEAEATVNLTLTATDANDSSLTYSEEFSINVINVNEAPFDITLDNNSVEENQSGAVIGNVGVSDPDNVPEFTNNLVTVDDDRFEVVNDGGTLQLKLKDDQSLDFAVEESLTLTLTATDINDGSLTYSEEFTLNVINEDEPQPPSDIELDGDTIAENADGAVIGVISVSDPDSGFGDNIVTVSDSRFEVENDGDTLQLKLKAGQSLNYEAETTVNLTLTATDSTDSSLTYSEEFTINVINVNEAPDDLTLDNSSVEENQLGAVIGNVGVSDPDNVPEFTNNLVTVNDDRFEVVNNGGTLQLKLKDDRSLDFETEPTVTVNLTATDAGDNSLTYSEEFIIDVLDVDEPVGSIRGIKWNDLNENGVRDSDLVEGSNPDVVYVLDVSGSSDFNFVGTSIGDLNNDGLENTRLDAEIAAFIGLNNQLINQELGDQVRVAIVVFSGSTANADMDLITDGLQLSITLGTDSNNDGITDVEEILRSIRSGAFGVGNDTGTNLEAALQKVEETFITLGTEAGNGNLIFLTDGEQNRGSSINDEVTRLQEAGFNLSAFGVGDDASLDVIQAIDPDGIKFTSIDEILEAFGGIEDNNSQSIFEPLLSGVTVYLDINANGTLDNNEPFQITAEDDPTTPNIDETGQYEFTDVPVGNYVVREVIPQGFTQTAPSKSFYEVEVIEGEVIDNIDFGNVEEENPIN